MRRVAAGDASAFRTLSDRHLNPVLAFSTRLLGPGSDAEDVTQETFLRLWQHAPTWQPRARLSTWLYRVARNACTDRLRLRQRRPGDLGRGAQSEDDARARDSGVDLLPTSQNPAGLAERRQLAVSVQAALDALPERQRAALVLVHYQGLSGPEAAEALEVGVEALESLLARARRTLRQTLAPLVREPLGDAP